MVASVIALTGRGSGGLLDEMVSTSFTSGEESDSKMRKLSVNKKIETDVRRLDRSQQRRLSKDVNVHYVCLVLTFEYLEG